MQKRLVLVVLAVLVAGGVGYLAGQGRERAASSAAPDAAADAQPVEDASSAVTDRSVASVGTAPAMPLPPVGTPLAQIHDELRRRAAAGEAGAACRLASEHERCEMERVQLRGLESQIESVDSASRHDRNRIPPEAQQQWAHRRAQIEAQAREKAASVAQCDAVPALSPDARAGYWRQAALAGHVPAMRHYASGNGFRWHDLMDALPTLQTYRREAEGIARRAALQGDAASAYALAMAYADSGGQWRSFLAQTIAPDLSQALAWFSVLARHPDITRLPPEHPTARSVSHHLATLQAAASPSETAQADALAKRVVMPAAPSAEAPGTAIRPDGGFGDIAPVDCGDTAASAGQSGHNRPGS